MIDQAFIPRILVVDDIPANIVAMKKLLKDSGAEIVEATNGNDALALSIKHEFALILLDVQMPEMSGYEVAEYLRGAEKTKHTPIIFVTANMLDEMNVLKGYDVGAVDYIAKPINKEVLHGKVNVFLDLYNQNQELRDLRVAADHSSRMKSEFLATMSHEIRTPLNAIIGMTELLLDHDTTAEQNRKLNTVLYSSETLLQLINDILDFSKIESDEMSLESISFDLHALAKEVTDVLAIKAYDKRIEFILQFGEGLPRHVFGDPVRIKQIIYNIAGNAIKFTEKGHVGIDVDARRGDGDELLLTIQIEDTGIGIPKEKHEGVFERFTQADGSTTRKYGGTGLGLAICRRLVDMMNGTIALQSEPGKGSKFVVAFPMQEDTVKNTATLAPADLLEGLKLLVVDDSPAIRTYLCKLLSAVGVDVHAVGTASQAMDELHNGIQGDRPFHIVLVDFMMPDVDGLDFGKMVKNSQTVRDTLLVMLTAYPRKGLDQELKESGFSGFAAKPLGAEQLLKLLIRVREEYKKGGKAEIVTQNLIEAEDLHIMPERNSAEFQGIKTLLVEDNRVNRAMAEQMLQDLGCEVAIAEDGAMAVERIQGQTFDLVFMDCQMPNLDGYEATRIIKEDMEKGSVGLCPIIAFTANALKGDREKCFAAGMNDYMTKPVRQDEIKQMLAKWLQ